MAADGEPGGSPAFPVSRASAENRCVSIVFWRHTSQTHRGTARMEGACQRERGFRHRAGRLNDQFGGRAGSSERQLPTATHPTDGRCRRAFGRSVEAGAARRVPARVGGPGVGSPLASRGIDGTPPVLPEAKPLLKTTAVPDFLGVSRHFHGGCSAICNSLSVLFPMAETAVAGTGVTIDPSCYETQYVGAPPVRDVQWPVCHFPCHVMQITFDAICRSAC